MIDIRVIPDSGEPWDVKITARDILKWERLGQGRSVAQLEAGAKLIYIYELAHLASQRVNKFSGSLELFEETCELSFQGADDDEDFTQKAASITPVSPSPSPQESHRRNGQTRGRRR